MSNKAAFFVAQIIQICNIFEYKIKKSLVVMLVGERYYIDMEVRMIEQARHKVNKLTGLIARGYK